MRIEKTLSRTASIMAILIVFLGLVHVQVSIYASYVVSVSVIIWDYNNSDVYYLYQGGIAFYSSINGSPGTYSYQWYVNSTPAPNENDYRFFYYFNSAGSVTVYLIVTDGSRNSYMSNILTKTITYPILIDSNSTTIMLGDSVLFNVTSYHVPPPSGGYWYINDTETGVFGGTGGPWVFTPTETGCYLVSFWAHGEGGDNGGSNTIAITVFQPSALPGDINLDGKVSLADLVSFANAYGSKPGDPNWNPNADIDGNGLVGLSDLVILARNYGRHYP